MGEPQFLRRGQLTIKALQPLPGTSSFTDAFGPQVTGQQQAFITITEDARFTFKWTKNFRPHPNVGECTVTNLSKETRAQIQGKGIRVEISGGYGDNIGPVGVMDGRVNHKHEGPEWETKIQGRDGGSAIDFGRLNKAWAGKTPVSQVVYDLGASLGKTFTDDSMLAISSAIGDKRFPQGWSTSGYSYWELNSILLQHGLILSIQDDKISVAERDGTEGFKASQELFLIDASSSLIGSPEYQGPPKPGHPQLFKIKMLFNPKLRMYGRIQLDALYQKGMFKIMVLTHTCDTYGGDWYTETECQALSNGR